MNEIRAVSISHVKSTVRCEADVCRSERCLLTVVFSRLDRKFFSPDQLAFESRLAEVAFPHAREIEELFSTVVADIDPVPSSVMLFAERANTLSVSVENDDRIANRLRFRTMCDVNQPFGIDCRPVSILPLDRVRNFAPVVMALVDEVAFSDDGVLRSSFVCCVKKGWSDGRSDSRSSC